MYNIKRSPLSKLVVLIIFVFNIPSLYCQIVKPYTGKVNCTTLTQEAAHFSRILIGRFCQGATQACHLQTMMHKLDKNNPLLGITQDRLQDYINLQLEICEMAFAVNAPEYYEKYLSRLHPTAPISSSPHNTEAVSQTFIE